MFMCRLVSGKKEPHFEPDFDFDSTQRQCLPS